MLGSIKGFDVSGIYSIAFFIGLSIEMPKRAISTISLPIIVKHFNENNLPEINKLYKQSSINQGIIGAFLLLLVMVNLDEIFMLLPKSEIYSVGKYVAIFIGLSRLIDMITGCNSEILRASSYYYLDIFLFFLLIVLSVFTNYLLIPIYGLNGAAIASLLSMILYNFVRFILLKKLFNFNPFTVNTIKLIALLALLTLGNESLPIQAHSTMEALFFLLAKSILFSLLFGFIVFKAKLSDEVNQLITTFKHKVVP
jgi:O-antigen/teichoic acid export membrane protein